MWKYLVLLAGGAIVLTAGAVRLWQGSAIGPPPAPAGYVGSTSCLSCHADHHASWRRTYHRTMTQTASRQSVLGDFSGTTVEQAGRLVRPIAREGRYFFEYLDPRTQAVQTTVELVRTVGSHRYQQYLSRDRDGRYARMHLIWHRGDQRWVHYNGAFLYDDTRQHFNQHAALWNNNCIFCHNTGVQPGMSSPPSAGATLDFNSARWNSQVAELGIACEACHGPGSAHAQANRNPLRRYRLHRDDTPDPTIVNPARLDSMRASQVCGQCHGQRMPRSDAAALDWLRSGPSYRPGDDLQAHVQLVQADTTVPAGDPDTFRRRFWADGSPRLSAYEYQGLSASPCFTQGQARCQSCHSSHGGDPSGMITAENRQGAACTQCHADTATQPVHRQHAARSPKTTCVDCHMPKAVYGVMEIHRSHRIEKPAPASHAAQQRPDACTGCHADRSAAWADAAQRAWRADAPPPADTGLPENLRQLFAGDPVQQAVAARLVGVNATAMPAAARLQWLPLLVAAMDSPYPAVRRFAWLSAQTLATSSTAKAMLPPLRRYDFMADAPRRAAVVAELQQTLPVIPGPGLGGMIDAHGRINAVLLDTLRQQADTTPIQIGE